MFGRHITHGNRVFFIPYNEGILYKLKGVGMSDGTKIVLALIIGIFAFVTIGMVSCTTAWTSLMLS